MALPVVRTFSGVNGVIPTADEVNWAYNINNGAGLRVETGSDAGGYCQANDPTSDSCMHWTADSFTANQFSEVVMGDISTNGGLGNGYGPAVRCDTGTTQKTMYRLVADSHGWELDRFNNGTTTVIASDTTPPVRGDVIRLSVETSGANAILTLTKNGVGLVGSPFTDTSPLTSGAPGVAHSSTTSSAGTSQWGVTSVTMDNIVVGGDQHEAFVKVLIK